MAAKTKWIFSLAALLATGAQASGSLWINEYMINAPGGGDNGFEFVELKSSTSSMSLTGLSLVYLEGGPGGANMGDVDNIVNLGALSTGTNGLLLLRSMNPDAFRVIVSAMVSSFHHAALPPLIHPMRLIPFTMV